MRVFRCRAVGSVLIAALVWMWPSDLCAKNVVGDAEGMELHLFRAAVDTKGHFTIDGTPILPHLSFSLGMMLDFSFNTPIAVEQSGDFYDKTMVERAIWGVFFANLGLLNRLVVGLQIPMGITSGIGYNGVETADNEPSLGWSNSGAFGDLAIHAKAGLLRSDRDPVGIGLLVQYQLGTGQSELLLGGPGKAGTVSGKFIFDVRPAAWYRAALNIGGRYPFSAKEDNHLNEAFNQSSQNLLFHYGPMVSAGLGQSFGIWPGVLDFVVEAYANQLATRFDDTAYMSVEANGGFKLYVDGYSYLMAGAAGGIPISDTDSGYGFQGAQWRLFLGFAFEPSIGDRDRDGILDDEDACPDNPEDLDGFEDSDGCPDPDNDKDGIPDEDDDCPLIPEDMDGDEDQDGCPEQKEVVHDRDGDGIIDENDECPDVPEDKDGFEDADGCSDLDNDRDGIPDRLDDCPRVREVLNGFEDEDGCPDEGEELVTITKDQVELLKGIRFKTASDEIIGQQSFDILNAVVTVLKANPQIRVQIEGHTDSRGGRRYNLDLSERRARSVMRYLYENGIDKNRMRAKGFGPDQPVDTNDTDEGRAANRRVVFAIIQD